jgi:AMP phosphorylase
MVHFLSKGGKAKMKLKVIHIHINAGPFRVVLLHSVDACRLSIKEGDRVQIKNKVFLVDITKSRRLLSPGEVGLFEQSYSLCKEGANISVSVMDKPKSIFYISKKLRGERLTKEEIYAIIQDITDGVLTDIEMTYFVSACYMHELNDDETVWFTNAMVETGKVLSFDNGTIIADKHCIGGVAGNRTTCLVVPIIAAAGITIPKTSSRSITSPAGTSDTMEILCDVSLSLAKMKSVVKKTGACLAWGGSMDIAPSDDVLIKVEHPMSLDPIGQMLASVLAKKKAAGSTHVLIDIPWGKGSKVPEKERAVMLKSKFERIGKRLGMNVVAMLTDGTSPIGNGIGPALEARDVLLTLQCEDCGSTQLREKSIAIAGELLELCGKAASGKGALMAKMLLHSGKAAEKFFEIVQAQGNRVIDPKKIVLGTHTFDVVAISNGTVAEISNRTISTIAKLAGAPSDKGAGLYIHKHVGDTVLKGDVLYTIYAESKSEGTQAFEYSTENIGYGIK